MGGLHSLTGSLLTSVPCLLLTLLPGSGPNIALTHFTLRLAGGAVFRPHLPDSLLYLTLQFL